MKKTLILLSVAFLSITIFSCKKEEAVQVKKDTNEEHNLTTNSDKGNRVSEKIIISDSDGNKAYLTISGNSNEELQRCLADYSFKLVNYSSIKNTDTKESATAQEQTPVRQPDDQKYYVQIDSIVGEPGLGIGILTNETSGKSNQRTTASYVIFQIKLNSAYVKAVLSDQSTCGSYVEFWDDDKHGPQLITDVILLPWAKEKCVYNKNYRFDERKTIVEWLRNTSTYCNYVIVFPFC